MVTINLSNNPRSSFETESAKVFFLDKGAVYSIALLVLVGLGWLGTSLYVSSLEKKKMSIQENIQAFLGGATSDENADRVADFSQRVNLAVKEFEADHNPAQSLKEITAMMVRDVYIDTAEYDLANKQYILGLKGSSYSALAQQIASLKKSDFFRGGLTVEDSGSGAGARSGEEDAASKLSVRLSFSNN